jgi:hypothetical protein
MSLFVGVCAICFSLIAITRQAPFSCTRMSSFYFQKSIWLASMFISFTS